MSSDAHLISNINKDLVPLLPWPGQVRRAVFKVPITINYPLDCGPRRTPGELDQSEDQDNLYRALSSRLSDPSPSHIISLSQSSVLDLKTSQSISSGLEGVKWVQPSSLFIMVPDLILTTRNKFPVKPQQPGDFNVSERLVTPAVYTTATFLPPCCCQTKTSSSHWWLIKAAASRLNPPCSPHHHHHQ